MATETVDALARQALDLAKNALLVHVRFMNAAFARLRPLPIPGSTLATDGTHIRYDSAEIARMYAEEPASVARGFLHVILHNVFLHLYPSPKVDALRWNTACDIAVEHVISELDLPAARTQRVSKQNAAIARITAALDIVTAETIYRYLVDTVADDEEVELMREAFIVDDHDPWHAMAAEEEARRQAKERKHVEENNTGATQAATKAGEDGTKTDIPEEAKDAKKSHSSKRGLPQEEITQKETPEDPRRAIGERFADTVNLDRSRDQWKNAAYEMGVQLDTYVQLWGAEGSNLAMNLKTVTREKHDYREFLRKFARMGEHMKINDDEFDYVYYCYGLSHYGNLPLIEPLEYNEEKRIRDFVIAIDTSSSTKDGLVRKFIEKTYSILSDETSFFSDMNVVILQCDAAITDVTRISSLGDLNDYLDDLEIKGLGGTDFRPVFAYVDEALERGDFSKLGGLIYFTDGQGTYPARKPDYPAAFVLVEDDTGVEMPVWAIKVVLEETALIEE